ncbi:uncharacterized protein [Nicotiana tomentosiformis]|uniref:uncharacterized protein n=1 Tax=Nicotiana tomentosiformis TaxID=4098 RepID=UPI00388C5994
MTHPVHHGASSNHGSYSARHSQSSLSALLAQSSSCAPSVQGSSAPGASNWYSGSRGPPQYLPPFSERGQFVRCQSSRPTYPAPTPSQGTLVWPYFSAIPESSYRPPTIQGSSSGSSGPPSQIQGQSSSTPRGYFECGDLGHVKRFYPRLQGKAVQQGHQPMIIAPATAPVVRTPRDGGQVSSWVLGHSCINVSTPVGDSVVVDRIYRSCIMTLCGYEIRADLLLLDMTYFEVILGMDWVSLYHVVLDCHAKTINLVIPELPRLECKGPSVNASSRTPASDSVHVVQEFSDVFPSDLPGIPPERDIDFYIDLAPGTQPISIPPYRMAPKELKELKEQLEELPAKGFVRPRVSPWDAPVLFVKKKDRTMRICIDYR